MPKFKKLGAVSSKFKIADKQKDVRGWLVIGSGGTKVGYVDELVVDTKKKMVAFLDVMLNISFTKSEGKHILIPIEMANIYIKKKIVSVRNLSVTLANAYPVYEGYADEEHENLVRDFLAANISADNMLTDQLSPGRLEDVSNEIKLESDSDLILKLKKERDIAVAERDILLEENIELRKKLESFESNEEDKEEGPYRSGYTDCDDVDTGRKC